MAKSPTTSENETTAETERAAVLADAADGGTMDIAAAVQALAQDNAELRSAVETLTARLDDAGINERVREALEAETRSIRESIPLEVTAQTQELRDKVADIAQQPGGDFVEDRFDPETDAFIPGSGLTRRIIETYFYSEQVKYEREARERRTRENG